MCDIGTSLIGRNTRCEVPFFVPAKLNLCVVTDNQ